MFLTSQPQLISLVASLGTVVSKEIVASKEDLENYIRQRFEVARNKAFLEESLLKEVVTGASGT
jgi:hypothetical protein